MYIFKVLSKIDKFAKNINYSTISQQQYKLKTLLQYRHKHYLHHQCKDKIFNKKFSRYSANTIMSDGGIFNLIDYDIIGFDLDNTLACYNLPNMIKLEYKVLAEYLVKYKDYPKEILRPIDDDIDFLQRGLLLDADRGNLLKINGDGIILKASHGTRFLNDDEIIDIYGDEKYWNIAGQFTDDPLSTWNGPLSEKLRTFLDYFDLPASLCIARIIDAIDAKNEKCLSSNLIESRNQQPKYNIWLDVLDGLTHLYRREAFAEGNSKYFEEIKAEPQRYVLKINPKVINWLKEMKKTKAIYLLTGSNIDFVEIVANHAFGKDNDWKELFDIVIAYARKPGFFMDETRSFYEVTNMKEGKKIENSHDLKLNQIYSQGNWKNLKNLLKQKFNIKNPRCLYIGDNLIQDIYTPCKYMNCDTISVVNEMLEINYKNEENNIIQQQQQNNLTNSYNSSYENEFKNIISSSKWGSYFGVNNKPTVWTDIILNYSKICIPDIDYLAGKPINYSYNCFNTDCTKYEGFYPSKPIILHNVNP